MALKLGAMTVMHLGMRLDFTMINSKIIYGPGVMYYKICIFLILNKMGSTKDIHSFIQDNGSIIVSIAEPSLIQLSKVTSTSSSGRSR